MAKQNRNSLQVSWNNDWIHKFESSWGIFEKFKFANAATLQDIFHLFGTGDARKVKYRYGKYLRNLISLEGIDNKLLHSQLGIEIKKVVHNDLLEIAGKLPLGRNGVSTYFNEILVYCEECMSLGYHSWLHQFKLLHVCPFHHSKLKKKCTRCNSYFPFLLSDENSPFKCKCGYSFIKENYNEKISLIWKEAENLTLDDELTNKWFLINRQNNFKVEFLYDLYNYEKQDLFQKIINAFHTKDHLENNYKNFIKINIYNNKKRRILYHDNLKLLSEIEISSNQCLKSLTRYIKKTHLQKHISCISRYKKMRLCEEEICPIAFAYVHWKKSVKGLKKYWEVDNGSRLKRSYPIFPFYFDFASQQDSAILFDLWYRLVKASAEFEMGHPEMISIINRVMCILAINHFNNWVKFAHELSVKDSEIYKGPKLHENLPFFIIKIQKKDSGYISFWTDISDKRFDIGVMQSCLFSK